MIKSQNEKLCYAINRSNNQYNASKIIKEKMKEENKNKKSYLHNRSILKRNT